MNEAAELQTPPPPPPEGGGEVAGNPWERREALGLASAFIENLKLFIVSPSEAFAQTRRRGDLASPLLFAIVVGWFSAVISQLWGTLLGASMLTMFPGEMQDQFGAMAAGSAVSFVIYALLAPIFILVALFIWSALLHLCLVLVGGLKESTAGFEGTVRVVSYSSVAQLANLVPFVGGILGLVWTIVLGVIGFTTLHRSSQGQAIAAILIPVLICCVCIAMFLAVAGASLMGLFAHQ
jgi:hypothetical protein